MYGLETLRGSCPRLCRASSSARQSGGLAAGWNWRGSCARVSRPSAFRYRRCQSTGWPSTCSSGTFPSAPQGRGTFRTCRSGLHSKAVCQRRGKVGRRAAHPVAHTGRLPVKYPVSQFAGSSSRMHYGFRPSRPVHAAPCGSNGRASHPRHLLRARLSTRRHRSFGPPSAP